MKRFALFALLLLCSAPAAPARGDNPAATLPIGDPARRDRQVAVVLDGIVDTALGDTIGPAEMAARLDGVQIVFVGESHVEMDYHRAQLRVLQELHRRGRTVMIGLEMYPVPEQKWLDHWYKDKKLAEAKFLDESHWYKNWGYHWNYYRDIFLFAREQHLRMFAINLPRGAVSTVRSKGFDSLSAADRALLPPKVDVDNAEHQQLFRAFFGDADALHGNMPPEMFQGMFRAQCAWDAAMGWNALQALQKYGDKNAIMVVLIGSGHVSYGLGAERQVKPWFGGRTATVVPMPIADEPGGKLIGKVQASYANFVWGLPPITEALYPSLGISTPEAKSGERYKVIMVAKDSPADLAGFEKGDELVSLDGVAITEKETLNQIMSTKSWGDDAACRVMRDGAPVDLKVHLRRSLPTSAAADSAATDHKPDTPAPPAMPPMPPKSPGGGEH